MSYHWNLQVDEGARHSILTGWDRQERFLVLPGIEVGDQIKDAVIRLVETSDDISLAADLINDRYVLKGYGDNHVIPASTRHATFTAEIDEEIVATVTLGVDSQRGLAADKTFRCEIDGYRDQGNVVACELVKFAFKSRFHSKKLMAALFHIVFVYGRRTFGGTDLFIEVNPRHVRFYETMLGFDRVGGLKRNESVGCELQLLHLKVSEVRKHIDAQAGSADASAAHSLYPLFFSRTEEAAVCDRFCEPELLVC